MKQLYFFSNIVFILFVFPFAASGQNENVLVKQRARSVYWSESFNIGTTSGTTDGGSYLTSNGTWTVAGSNGAIWKHSFSGAQGEPAFAGDLSGDGWMLFDVDSAGGGMPDGELISPRIDLTGAGSFFFRFKQYYKVCCYTDSLLFFGISTDDGTSWSEFDTYHYLVQSDLRSENPEEFRINAASVFAGVSDLTQVRIRFRWRNNGKSLLGKFWIIDEISIEEAPDYDMKIEEVRFYSPLSHWQGQQVEYFGNPTSYTSGTITGSPLLIVRYRNNGKLTATDTRTIAEVLNGVNGNFVSAHNSIGGNLDIAPGEIRVDTVIGFQFYDYRVTVQIEMDNSDDFPADNIHPEFRINGGHTINSVKLPFSPRGVSDAEVSMASPEAIYVGNVFKWTTNHKPGFLQVYFNAVNNATVSGIVVYPFIMEINDTVQDFSSSLTMIYHGGGTVHEMEVFSTALSTISAIPFHLCIWPQANNLVAGRSYLIGVGIYGAPDWASIQNGEVDHPGQKTSWVYRISTGWKWIQQTPKILLGFAPWPCGGSVEENEASSGIVLQQNHPNPFSEETFIEFELIRSNRVELEVRDVLGKLVYSKSLGTLVPGEHMVSMSASELSSGIYYYSLATADGRITKKMIIE